MDSAPFSFVARLSASRLQLAVPRPGPIPHPNASSQVGAGSAGFGSIEGQLSRTNTRVQFCKSCRGRHQR